MKGWSIRGKCSRRFHDLHNRIMQIELPHPGNGSDIVMCKHQDDDFRTTFSASRTWEQVRSKRIRWNGAR